jgi:hypothetical protein
MPDCGNTGSPPWFLPIIFWFFTYDPNPPQGSATVCAPAISLWDVAVTVDIATGNLTTVVELRPFDASNSPFSSFSGNITGAPLNGLAYNGIGFDMGDADQFVTARAAATDLQLPAAVQQAAESSPGGLPAAFSTNSFPDTATRVYVSVENRIISSSQILNCSTDNLLENDCEVCVLPSHDTGLHPRPSEKLYKTAVAEVSQRSHYSGHHYVSHTHLTGISVTSPFILRSVFCFYSPSLHRLSNSSIGKAAKTYVSGISREQ